MKILKSINDAIAGFFNEMVTMVLDVFIFIINGTIEFIAYFLDALKELLPACTPDWGFVLNIPAQASSMGSFFGPVLSFINWIFPVDVCAQSLAFIMCNLGFYFSIGIVLRWLKVTQ